MSLVIGDQTDVTLSFAHKDSNGDISPSAGSYSVVDEQGSILVSDTSLTISGTSSSVTILAAQNTLAATATRGAREVVVTFTVGGNSLVFSQTYMVEKNNILEVMENTYQTFLEAELNASLMPELEVWSGKPERDRKAALVQAYHRLGGLSYKIVDQQYDDDTTITEINRLTKDQFTALVERFRDAIKRAQIVEADVILGGDRLGSLRREGLMSDSVGESAQFFRSSKPLALPISVRAMRHLRGFVNYSIGITRG